MNQADNDVATRIASFLRRRIEDERSYLSVIGNAFPHRDLWLFESPAEGNLQLAISAARLRVELEMKERLATWAAAEQNTYVLSCLAMPWDDHTEWESSWSPVQEWPGGPH